MTEPTPESPANGVEVAKTRGDSREFSCLEAFVKYLVQILTRKATPRRTWCPQWWDHPEAVHRLWALWDAWEVFNLEGGVGPSSWWVYHLDHHLAVLFDPEIGPFSACRDGHKEMAPLPCEPAPDKAGPVIVGSRGEQGQDAGGAGDEGQP